MDFLPKSDFCYNNLMGCCQVIPNEVPSEMKLDLCRSTKVDYNSVDDSFNDISLTSDLSHRYTRDSRLSPRVMAEIDSAFKNIPQSVLSAGTTPQFCGRKGSAVSMSIESQSVHGSFEPCIGRPRCWTVSRL
jgi:hypothetical protein